MRGNVIPFIRLMKMRGVPLFESGYTFLNENDLHPNIMSKVLGAVADRYQCAVTDLIGFEQLEDVDESEIDYDKFWGELDRRGVSYYVLSEMLIKNEGYLKLKKFRGSRLTNYDVQCISRLVGFKLKDVKK